MSFIYSLLLSLLLPLLFIKRKINSLSFSSYPNSYSCHTSKQARVDFWIHASSVGEINSAFLLLKELITFYPTASKLSAVITCTTPAGLQQAYHNIKRHSIDNYIYLSYAPYDLSFLVNRFLKRFSPRALIIIEADIWRNMLSCARMQNIPTILADARLSERSLKQRQKYSFTMPRHSDMPNLICAQTDSDARNFLLWGVNPATVQVCGGIKFDTLIPAPVTKKQPMSSATKLTQETRLSIGASKVWIAASTHESEEKAVLDAHIKLLKDNKSTLLILAPRHPQRFSQVASLIKSKGLSFMRFSQLSKNFGKTNQTNKLCTPINTPAVNVLLLDTIGDLPYIYRYADIAFVGGSLAPCGGHNILEPLLLQIPVIIGPHHQNLHFVLELISKDSIAIINTKNELIEKLCAYSRLSKRSLQKQAFSASCLINSQRGASKNTAKMVYKLLNKMDKKNKKQ